MDTSFTDPKVCGEQHFFRHVDTVPVVRRNFLFLGVGALYVRRRPRVRIEALQSGGGQERGLRSGTVPTPLTVGLGAACEIAEQEMKVCPTHAHIIMLMHIVT